MKAVAWRWLALLLVPGCVLVQPLDEAKPDDDTSIPAGSGSGGKTGSSGGPSKAGSGSAGRTGSSGAPSSAGAPSGNGGGAGVDFSLFTGDWTVTGGENTTSCDPGTTQTAPIDTGGTTTFGLGTTSDLILDPGTTCEILVDVDDRTAALNSGTGSCSYSDSMYSYYVEYDSYEFTVSGDGKTANASMVAYIEVSDANDNASYCHSTTTWKYAR